MTKLAVMLAALAIIAIGASAAAVAAEKAGPGKHDPALVARGRYLIKLGGCNDCHTAGFLAAPTEVPERDWLEGNTLGFHGPWGTTYAVNLRRLVENLSEEDWLALLRTMQPKPPMPWWSLRWMTPGDQRAVYAFLRELGPAGREAPADLPPGVAPPPPIISFPAPPPAAKSRADAHGSPGAAPHPLAIQRKRGVPTILTGGR